jgi:RecB family exonuclease
LRAQAACPFQGFATQRLGASGRDLPEEGLDPAAQGTLLHKLLEQVWRGEGGLMDSAGLAAAIGDNTLHSLVAAKAELVTARHAGDGWQAELMALERERITDVCLRWLREVESKRAAFRVVAVERPAEFTLEGTLRFNVRIDRIDAVMPEGEDSAIESVAPGDLILLDYKTGKLEGKPWDPPNMDEPQLPLYAVHAFDSPPVAVAFASIPSTEELCIKGDTATAGLWPAKKPKVLAQQDYDAKLQEWRDDIAQLARSFKAGEAVLRPRHGDKTCKRCGLQSLCRVHQVGTLTADDDADFADSADSAEAANG